MLTRLRRALCLFGTPVAFILMMPLPARADDTVLVPGLLTGDVGGPLGWINLQNSTGLPLQYHDLSLDEGGVTSVGKFVWAFMAELGWGAYKVIVSLALWFIDWAISMSWLDIVATPILATGDALQDVVNRLGLVPTLLTLTALVAVFWMARGRWATGIYELALSLVIAAVASGALAQPVHMVAGDDGMIADVHHAGLEISSELTTGDSSGKSTETLVDDQMVGLTDAFLADPMMVINYGKVLSDACEKVAMQGLLTEVGLADSDFDFEARKFVEECDEAAGKYAANPSLEMTISVIVLMPAAIVIMILAVMISGSVVASGCYSLIQALKLIWHLITGLLPGAARGPLMLSIAELVMSLLVLAMTSIFLGIFLIIIQATFAGNGGGVTSPIAKFAIADVIIVVGLFAYWRQRAALKRGARTLASALLKRPGGGAGAPAPQKPLGIPMGQKAAALGMQAAHLGALRGAGRRRPQLGTGGPGTPPPPPKPAGDGAATVATSAPSTGRKAAGAIASASMIALTGGAGSVGVAAKAAKAAKTAQTVQVAATALKGRSTAAVAPSPKREALTAKLHGNAPRVDGAIPLPSAPPKTGGGLVHTPTPMPPTKRRFDRVIVNGRVVMVPRDEA